MVPAGALLRVVHLLLLTDIASTALLAPTTGSYMERAKAMVQHTERIMGQREQPSSAGSGSHLAQAVALVAKVRAATEDERLEVAAAGTVAYLEVAPPLLPDESKLVEMVQAAVSTSDLVADDEMTTPVVVEESDADAASYLAALEARAAALARAAEADAASEEGQPSAETAQLHAEITQLRALLAARELRAERELQATAAFWISKLASERARAH